MTSTITKTNEVIPIAIRLATKDDLSFIISSWCTAMKTIYPNRYAVDFVQHYREYLATLIDKSVGLVAYLEGDPHEIVSYLVYSSFRNHMLIHYAYTKVDARRQGHVRQLIEFGNPDRYPIVFTHPAKNEGTMIQLVSKYIYDPSMLEIC